MRTLSFLALLTFSFGVLGCGNIQGNHPDKKPNINEKTTSADGDIQPEYLTYDTFREKVWDFEANPQEWVYKGEVPCVIDFYADWCKPCKLVEPIMKELSEEYDGKVKIYKIDTDREKKLAGVFGIRSIPSIMFVPMNGDPSMQAGALPKSEYVRIINEIVLNKKSN